MQGRIAGFVMTLLMALPLAAIPLMAIFGIPQLGSLASPIEETGFLLEDPVRPNSALEGSAPAWEDTAAVSPPASASATEWGDWEQASPVENLQELSSRNETAARDRTRTIPSTQSVQGSLTWEEAVEILARYGIKDYRLQPGLDAQTFHFACYSRVPAGNPQTGESATATIIRFESEAADPLLAIQKTLQQVERWHRQRTPSLKMSPML